jgi:hypothetical protein
VSFSAELAEDELDRNARAADDGFATNDVGVNFDPLVGHDPTSW